MKKTTTLILDSDTEEEITTYRETDVHTALTRGLQEYIRSLQARQSNGQEIKLKDVIQDWADPEEVSRYPSCAIYTQDAGIVDDSSLTPTTLHVGNDGSAIRILGEFTQAITVDVWATSKPERLVLTMMLEEAFNPVDFMSGFRLALPHYFGAHADFLVTGIDYADGPDKAGNRTRLAQFQIDARVAMIRGVGKLPTLNPKVELTVEDAGT